MATLQQILDDIDARCPNSFTQSIKIGWINDIQRKVFREMAIQDIIQFKTIANQNIYNLVDDNANEIEFELVTAITIDKEKYEPADLNDASKSRFFYKLLDGKIGFYPNITETDLDVYVYFEKRPRLLTASDLSTEPDLWADYHDILKFGVMHIIAEARDDISKANNYALQYNSLIDEIKQKRFERMSKYPVTQDKLPKRRYYNSKSVVEVVSSE